jgi:hypothetical protein
MEHEDQSDDIFIALFQVNEQRAAADFVDEAFFTPPDMSEDEHRAILDGNRRRLMGEKKPWTGLVRCLRASNPSARFLEVVAALIEAEAFHNRGERGISTAEARQRRDYYAKILLIAYGKSGNDCRRRATDILAHAEKRADETYEKARTRVGRILNRGAVVPDGITEKIYRALNARS